MQTCYIAKRKKKHFVGGKKGKKRGKKRGDYTLFESTAAKSPAASASAVWSRLALLFFNTFSMNASPAL